MNGNPFAPPPEGTSVASPTGWEQPPPGAWIPPQQQGQWVYLPAKRGTNGFAIASMVLGIVWLVYLGSILALIFGYIALNQIKSNPNQGGRGMAIAGVVLGWIGVAILAVSILAAIVGSSGY
jgi:hypothetical protein